MISALNTELPLYNFSILPTFLFFFFKAGVGGRNKEVEWNWNSTVCTLVNIREMINDPQAHRLIYAIKNKIPWGGAFVCKSHPWTAKRYEMHPSVSNSSGLQLTHDNHTLENCLLCSSLGWEEKERERGVFLSLKNERLIVYISEPFKIKLLRFLNFC